MKDQDEIQRILGDSELNVKALFVESALRAITAVGNLEGGSLQAACLAMENAAKNGRKHLELRRRVLGALGNGEVVPFRAEVERDN